MLRLSLSISREAHLSRCRVISATECFWAEGLAHPGDPESVFDLPMYQETLLVRLASPFTQAFKDALRIARLLATGREIVLQIGQTAVHGPELESALVKFARLHPETREAAARRPVVEAFQPSVEVAEAVNAGRNFTMQTERFVWVQGRTTELPGYIWDTEGVITAIVPGYGLVKVGRIYEQVKRFDRQRHIWVERREARSFWQAVNRGASIPHCRSMGRRPSDVVIDIFSRLVSEQIRAERVQRNREAERFDPWLTAPDLVDAEWEESVTALEREMEREAQAYLALHEPPKPVTFSSAEPVRALGEHVRPVVKTDRQGRRWVLSVERQRSGYLHGWQRAA